MDTITGRHAFRYTGVRNHTGLDDRTLRKAAARGQLRQAWRGVYVPAAIWDALDPVARARLRIAAAHARSTQPFVVSHGSAALLHGIPLTGRSASEVDTLTSVAAGSRREHGFAKHATRAPDLEVLEMDGFQLTSVARTVVELAITLPFRDAVAAADWALAEGLPRTVLLDLVAELAFGPAAVRGRRVIAFADRRSGSPGESKSRALIEELGFPPPDLQTRVADADGLIGFVDFYWSEAALIGEFDGLVKLTDPKMLRGRTALQAVLDEKRRENRLRGTGPRVARWGWEDLGLQRLGSILFQAGLRPLQ